MILFGTAACTQKDVMVVVELPAANSGAVYKTTQFVENLRSRLVPDKKCMRIGFIFVWKKAESVINLNCDYKACFQKGKRIAQHIERNWMGPGATYDRNEVIKGLDMAAKELLPDGVNLTKHREKVSLHLLTLLNEIVSPK